jgi:hypothetical protein
MNTVFSIATEAKEEKFMSSIDQEIKHVLDMRLAKGDIDIEQYKSLLKTVAEGDNSRSFVPQKTEFPLMLHPGSMLHAWRKISSPSWTYRLHSRYHTNYDVKNRLQWLGNLLDYVITDEYFIILSSPPDTKFQRIAENISSVGIVGGALGGALFVSLPAALAGAAYQKLFGTENKLDPEALAAIYADGYLIHAKKSDLTFLSFSIKPSSFEFAYAILAIFGTFKHATLGDVDLCFILSEKQGLNPNISVLKPLKAANCSIKEGAETLASLEIDNYLPPYFPDPLKRFFNEITWCPNCSHYQEQKAWNKGVSFFSMKSTGDHTLKTKPSNEKLPCQIPTEAASAWDRYFGISKENRAIYPNDCSLFIPKSS